MKLLALLLFPALCFAQKNEVTAYVMGNFNPAYFAVQSGSIFAGDNSAAIAYGLDYIRTLSKHNALGLLAGTDNVLAELYNGNNSFQTWTLRRYEVSILAQQQFKHKSWTGFMFEGPAVILTRSSPLLTGTTGTFAVTTGFGFEYAFSKHFGERSRLSFLDSNTGCYGDHACHSARWSVAQDLWSGLAFRW